MHGMKDDVTKIKESQMMMTIRQELEEKMCRRRFICIPICVVMVMCSTGMYKVKVHVGQSQVVNHAIRARYCENASKHHFPPGADDYRYLTC